MVLVVESVRVEVLVVVGKTVVVVGVNVVVDGAVDSFKYFGLKHSFPRRVKYQKMYNFTST